MIPCKKTQILLHSYKENSLYFLLTKHILLHTFLGFSVLYLRLYAPISSNYRSLSANFSGFCILLKYSLQNTRLSFGIISFLHFPAFKLFNQFCSSWRTTILHKIQIVINNTVTTNQNLSKDDKLFSFSDLYFSLHLYLLRSMVAEYVDLQSRKMPVGNTLYFMHFFNQILVVMCYNLQS